MKTFAFRPKEYGYFTGDDGEPLRNFDHWVDSGVDGLVCEEV